MDCRTTASITFSGGSTIMLHKISHRSSGRRWQWFRLGSWMAGVWVVWDNSWLQGSIDGQGDVCGVP